ncbi:MAG TPA: serine/threonine-protein kinase, partial [Urbifossiella sp.]|nr:serine/threonine-protein kinase [Urbifossiella sp.]
MKDTAVITAPLGPDDPGDFFHALRTSRLLPEVDVAAMEAQTRPGELPALFDVLLGKGMLTAYQLDQIRRGESGGLVIGPYHVLGELGRGGGGVVFRARHAVMGRDVALKVVSPAYGGEAAVRYHFRREVAATTALRHPNVVLTYDANEAGGVLYLAMELIAGPTLQGYVTEHGPLPVPLACAVLRETTLALDYAHQQGLVHRDVKPANVMLPGAADPDGRAGGPLVKVVDFGLARFARLATTIHCPDGASLGTPAFMAPEQIRNIHAADIRSDLYSLGCTFYYALTGQLPFAGGSAQATLLLQLQQEPRPVRGWRP